MSDSEDDVVQQAVVLCPGQVEDNSGIPAWRAHSTPDPDSDPPPPSPNPDDVPPPVNAPVQEPTLPEPPIKARPGLMV